MAKMGFPYIGPDPWRPDRSRLPAGFAVIYGVILTAAFIWLFVIQKLNRTTAPVIAFWFIFH